MFNHARDICREVMRNITVTTNYVTEGSQVKDLTITNDSGTIPIPQQTVAILHLLLQHYGQ